MIDVSTGAEVLVLDERPGREVQSWWGPGHGPLRTNVLNCKGDYAIVTAWRVCKM